MKIKALLIDDDFKACKNLNALLSDYCENVEVVGEAYTLNEAVEKIKALKPELLFLDMHLENEVGFDLFNKIDLKDVKVIVVSAFEDFALKAFEFSAIDYILKPVNPARLISAVNKIFNELEKSDSINTINTLIKSFEKNSAEKSTVNNIGIPTIFGSTFIDYNKIIRCEANRNYTRIYLLDDNPIMSSKNLSEIESLLPSAIFSRVHHSHVINLNQMVEYHKGKNGYLVMSDQSQVQISQNKKASFINRIK